MNPSLFLAALCLGIASAAPKLDPSLDAQWYQWKATHRRLYGVNKEAWRRAVWEKNMRMIELHNQEYSQGKHGFTMAMNAFGDMTNEEFRQVMNGLHNQTHKKGRVFREPLSAELPTSVDWRKKGYVTPVKNQDGSCKYKPEYSAANDTGFLDIQQQEKFLMEAVATVGPISAGIDASLESFQFYKEGIYYDPDCSSKDLDHGVLVVGYGFEGKDSRNKYWLVKNSWGEDWGMNGYIKMAKDQKNHCGIATMASYPSLGGDKEGLA
uniref:Cathepsin L n=1 Tax=Equus asinus TaxID=9793 RepID=A0A9L0IHT0_EQUAS